MTWVLSITSIRLFGFNSYVGALGGLGSYLTIWSFLSISTINTVGQTYISPKSSSSEYIAQMIIWHNLLAIWLWRFLISGIEHISIPGLVSGLDLILHYLPSYFLWMTVFLFGMLVTEKTAGKDNVSFFPPRIWSFKPDSIVGKWLLNPVFSLLCSVESGYLVRKVVTWPKWHYPENVERTAELRGEQRAGKE